MLMIYLKVNLRMLFPVIALVLFIILIKASTICDIRVNLTIDLY